MKPFKKQELLTISAIFLCLIFITLFNLRIAVRRSRDVQRRADLGAIANALEKYNEDFGYFPLAQGGRLKACKADNFNEVVMDIQDDLVFDRNKYFTGLRECSWGEDNLRDLLDATYEPYLNVIPQDPKEDEGISYLYISSGGLFQIYAYLEGEESEEGYNPGIVERNLRCGSQVCNFGKTYADTPLDKSLEEYEEELQRLKTG